MRHVREKTLKFARRKIAGWGYKPYNADVPNVGPGEVLVWFDIEVDALARVIWKEFHDDGRFIRPCVMLAEPHPHKLTEVFPERADLFVGPMPVEPEVTERECDDCGGQGLLGHSAWCELGHVELADAVKELLAAKTAEVTGDDVQWARTWAVHWIRQYGTDPAARAGRVLLALLDGDTAAQRWKNAALWLADCHAATAEYDGHLSVTSRARSERFVEICRAALVFVEGGQGLRLAALPASPVREDMEIRLDRVVERLKAAIKKGSKR